MDPIFSQIPSAILNRANLTNGIPTYKKPKFYSHFEDDDNYIDQNTHTNHFVTQISTEPNVEEDDDCENNLTTHNNEGVPEIISKKPEEPLKSALKSKVRPQVLQLAHNDIKTANNNCKPDSSSEGKCFHDAIIQTDIIETKPLMLSRSTQTIESWLRMDAAYEEYRDKLKSDSLASNFNPMYSLNNSKPNAPLKIGLSLKGRKRKVFYPDEEE